MPDGQPGDAPAEAPAAGAKTPGEPREEPVQPDEEHLTGPLPEGVRERVVSLASDTLDTLPPDQVPLMLRPFARFQPVRRAKLAATPLAAAVENDTRFRQRIADRVREALPDLATALDAGRAPAAADPLDVAAAAYLLRPSGWSRIVEEIGQRVARERAEAMTEQAAEETRRLQEQVSALRNQAKAEAERFRTELEAARKEIEALRRQLRQAREEARKAEQAQQRAEQTLARIRGQAQADRQRAEAEQRRLRNRLAEAEAALEASRKAARAGRSLDDMRVRLLLDTLQDAAQGLLRELALPPLTERPADTVEAVSPTAAGPLDLAQQARENDDPALLDQLLALPQAHLIVDGYNVTKTGYGTLTLSEQRFRLLAGLGALAAQTGAEITCVFDGADLVEPVLLATPRGVRVLFSRQGETADELIRRLVRAEPHGRAVIVVSSDREVMEGVRRAGARPVPATMLLRRLARG
ncbi:RNA-binding protein [Carbonactinospora thermoautotrophica]|nr:RNA-binding protein [Carbonactinospora thermoautotrophica]